MYEKKCSNVSGFKFFRPKNAKIFSMNLYFGAVFDELNVFITHFVADCLKSDDQKMEFHISRTMQHRRKRTFIEGRG